MELLTSPKSKYLLEASLEVLHQQTREWLSEIAFWRDEAAFFYTLIVKRTIHAVPVNAREIIEKVENELINMGLFGLNELQKEVEGHESLLNNLLKDDRSGPGNYREEHKRLTERMARFELDFKSLKREVFSLVEKASFKK